MIHILDSRFPPSRSPLWRAKEGRGNDPALPRGYAGQSRMGRVYVIPEVMLLCEVSLCYKARVGNPVFFIAAFGA